MKKFRLGAQIAAISAFSILGGSIIVHAFSTDLAKSRKPASGEALYNLHSLSDSCLIDSNRDDFADCLKRLDSTLQKLDDDQIVLLQTNREISEQTVSKLRENSRPSLRLASIYKETADLVEFETEAVLNEVVTQIETKRNAIRTERKCVEQLMVGQKCAATEDNLDTARYWLEDDTAKLEAIYSKHLDLNSLPENRALPLAIIREKAPDSRVWSLIPYLNIDSSCRDIGSNRKLEDSGYFEIALQSFSLDPSSDRDRKLDLLKDADVLRFLTQGGPNQLPVTIVCKERHWPFFASDAEYDAKTHTFQIDYRGSDDTTEFSKFLDVARKIARHGGK